MWFGTTVTAVLFTLGKFLIGMYLGRAGVGSAYGAMGSLAVLLVWLYYASQTFLFGVELTKAYANQLESRIKPKPYAEAVTPAARAEQGSHQRSEARLTRAADLDTPARHAYPPPSPNPKGEMPCTLSRRKSTSGWNSSSASG